MHAYTLDMYILRTMLQNNVKNEKKKKAMLGMWRNGFLTLYSIDFFQFGKS